MDKKMQYEPNQDRTAIAVTIHEASLISNMIYAALLNMYSLDDHQRKVAQQFMVKLQKAALSINRYPLSRQPIP